MTNAPTTSPAPALLAAVCSVREALDKTVSVQPTFLSTAQKALLLKELSTAQSQLHGLQLAVLADADDIAAENGATSAAAWLAHATRQDSRATRRSARLAASLDTQYAATGDALRAGDLSVEHAEAIVRGLDRLPDEVDAKVLGDAERHLIAESTRFTPQQIGRLTEHVLHVVAPEEYDDLLARQLERDEARAKEATRLTITPQGDGTALIRARVPEAIGQRLATYLEAIAAPRRAHLAGDDPAPAAGLLGVDGERVPYPQRLGEAFCSLLERFDPDQLPVHGGAATTVIVTIGLQALKEGLGTGELGTGATLTAAEARRLACTAGLVPAVLGGKSEPLDLGRSRRLFSPAQRKALVIRDRGCRADGCEIPASWCEAHHATAPWSRGGKTDLADGILLCSRHHHRAHDPAYSQDRLSNGDVRFHRRT